jgi:hypothetical protein
VPVAPKPLPLIVIVLPYAPLAGVIESTTGGGIGGGPSLLLLLPGNKQPATRTGPRATRCFT